jgi:hypothetical protein
VNPYAYEPEWVADRVDVAGYPLAFWTDASIYVAGRRAGLAVVAEEGGRYVLDDAMTVERCSDPTQAEYLAIVMAQRLVTFLSSEEIAQACIVTDNQGALALWHDVVSGNRGVPVFFTSPRRPRPRSYWLAHHLSQWASGVKHPKEPRPRPEWFFNDDRARTR